MRRRSYEAVALGAAGALALVASLSFLSGACGTTAGSVGPGGECSLATDCAPGLVCVEQENGTRTCTDDLSRVAGESPPDATASDAAADAVSDAPVARDTGTPDTGRDTGSPPIDASTD